MLTKSKEGLKSLKKDEYRFHKHISPSFGNKTPQDLTAIEIDKFKFDLLKDYKPATVKNILVIIQRIINHGNKKQLCPSLECKIEMPKVDNEKKDALKPDELKRLFEILELEEFRDSMVSHLVCYVIAHLVRRQCPGIGGDETDQLWMFCMKCRRPFVAGL